MTYNLNKKIVDDLMKEKGEVRGAVLKTDEVFIIFKGGDKKVFEIEQRIKELGQSLSYKKLNNMDFYPFGLRILSLLVIIDIFKMKENEIEEMGSMAPKMSFIMKFFIQYFLSVRKTFNQVPQIWQKHYTSGQLIPVKLDEKKRLIILKLENFNTHPAMYTYLSGYFSKVMEFIVKEKVRVKAKENIVGNKKSCIFEVKW